MNHDLINNSSSQCSFPAKRFDNAYDGVDGDVVFEPAHLLYYL